jgi:hypothetical protein
MMTSAAKVTSASCTLTTGRTAARRIAVRATSWRKRAPQRGKSADVIGIYLAYLPP